MKTLFRASLALPFFALAAAASAQLKLVSPNVTQTITFDSSQGWNDGINDNDVLRTWGSAWNGSGGENDQAVRLNEPNSWDYSEWNSGGSGLSTRAWRATGFPGSGGTFGDDHNGNSTTDEAPQLFQFAVIDGATFSGSPLTSKGLYFARDTWQNKELVLRVLNATGSSVPAFQIGLDTWFRDDAMNLTSLNVSVSTDDVTYSPFASRTSTNVGTGWSSLETLGGTTNTTVASGGYLYVKLAYVQNGRGNGFAFDNLSITPVPEPASMAVLGLGLAAFRRRRKV